MTDENWRELRRKLEATGYGPSYIEERRKQHTGYEREDEFTQQPSYADWTPEKVAERLQLEGDGGLGDEASQWPGIIEDNRRRYERLREPQRPSPEGLHAQRLREFGQALAAGMTSDEFLIPEGVDFFGAEPRERVEEQNQETPQEAPASTLPSAMPPSSHVPWHALREAVRGAIRSMEGDDLRRVPCDDDIEDDLVEDICRAALREIGEPDREKMRALEESRDYWIAKASRLGNLAMKYAEHDASACSVPGCQMPRHEAFAETWWTCEKHAPSAAREKPERPHPVERPPYTQPPHEPIWPVRVWRWLRCKLGLHRWDWKTWNNRTFPDQAFDPLRCARCGKERS